MSTGDMPNWTKKENTEYQDYQKQQPAGSYHKPDSKIIHNEKYGDRLEGCEIGCMPGVFRGHIGGCPNSMLRTSAPPGWPKTRMPDDGQQHWEHGNLHVFYMTPDSDRWVGYWKQVDPSYVDRYPFAANVSIEDANEIMVLRDMPYPQSLSVHLANEHKINSDYQDDQHQHMQAHLYGKFRDGAQHFHTKEVR